MSIALTQATTQSITLTHQWVTEVPATQMPLLTHISQALHYVTRDIAVTQETAQGVTLTQNLMPNGLHVHR